MAVPPNLISFVESAGLFPVASYGPDSQKQLEAEVFREWWTLRNPLKVLRQARAYVMDGWAGMNECLMELANGADLILTGTTYQELAANVAEARGMPLAALHLFPARANNHILPVPLPMSMASPLWAAAEWAHWRLLRPAYDEQRRSLGLPVSSIRAVRRLVEAGTLEIQTYDKAFFPGLEEQWRGKRPLVGGLTLQLASAADSSAASWIAAGKPPIYFGFGSMPVSTPAATIAMIVTVCREIGERALICSGLLALEGMPPTDDVMIVPSVNHARIFPLCRAVVHHGGAGTTAASVRAGVPTLVLWVSADQPVWAARIRHLGVGTSHRFSTTTAQSLRNNLLTVLGPRCTARAHEVASRMTPPERSVTATADLLEQRAADYSSCRITA